MVHRDARQDEQVFYYDRNWGTLIGYPPATAPIVGLNDHHFHYGYFIRAAAEIARVDAAWATTGCVAAWSVQLVVRDIANCDRADIPASRTCATSTPTPVTRGLRRRQVRRRQQHESSSEGMNAWSSLIQWGQATGNTAIRDVGVFLYTTEAAAIETVLVRRRRRRH